MYYGIEQSTDMRNRKTVIRKFSTESKLKKWMEGGGGYTYGDPDSARNHHRSFREGYILNGRVDKKDPIFKDRGTRDYQRCHDDNLASYIMRNGVEVLR